MNEIDELFAKLRAPFDADELEWRFQNFKKGDYNGPGLMMPYVQSRAVMDRLDAACGPGRWTDTMRCERKRADWVDRPKEGGLPIVCGYEARSWICTLDITLPDGTHVVHEDGADESDIEPTKGGISDALKRCAVKFGIGRYLYFLPKFTVQSKPNSKDWRPLLPPWARPGGSGRPEQGRGSSDGGLESEVEQPPVRAQRSAEEAIASAPSPARIDKPTPQPKAEGLQSGFTAGAAPFDLDEKVKFGIHKNLTWRDMASGSPDGKRHEWLQWMTEQDFNKDFMRVAAGKAKLLVAWLHAGGRPTMVPAHNEPTSSEGMFDQGGTPPEWDPATEWQ